MGVQQCVSFDRKTSSSVMSTSEHSLEKKRHPEKNRHKNHLPSAVLPLNSEKTVGKLGHMFGW